MPGGEEGITQEKQSRAYLQETAFYRKRKVTEDDAAKKVSKNTQSGHTLTKQGEEYQIRCQEQAALITLLKRKSLLTKDKEKLRESNTDKQKS